LRKLNKFITYGLIFSNIFLVSNQFNLLPEFFKGVFAGLGITFFIIGSLDQSPVISKFKTFKRNLKPFNR
jgi:hypothetical protein